MKKFKRKTPLVSPLKIAIATLYAAIATAIIMIFAGTDNVWYIICGGITATLLFCSLFATIGAGGQYRYTDKSIDVFYLFLPVKKLDYLLYSTVVISNASYNNGLESGVYGNIPMKYKIGRKNKVTFPFITLHKSLYPIDKVKSGMSSWDLCQLNIDDIYCLGICWFDSLAELLKHSNCRVYVLEDVYLRFKGKFDETFWAQDQALDRYYIITDHNIRYLDYFSTISSGRIS